MAKEKEITTPATPSTPAPKAEVMSLRSYITVKGYSLAILHRMEIYMANAGKDTEELLTVAQWDEYHEKTMKRVTK